MHPGLTRSNPQLIDALLLGDQLLSPETQAQRYRDDAPAEYTGCAQAFTSPVFPMPCAETTQMPHSVYSSKLLTMRIVSTATRVTFPIKSAI